jgi:predicted ATP-binding protein involved in virulence
MRIEKQSFSVNIRDHDLSVNNFRKHGNLFAGNSKRGLIIGPSGCGKTNVIISLIEDPNGLRFENVYIYIQNHYTNPNMCI